MGNNDDKQDLIFSVKLHLDFGGGILLVVVVTGNFLTTEEPSSVFQSTKDPSSEIK